MTQADSAAILRYANTIYPSARMTEAQINHDSIIWANEFSNNTREQVFEGFKMARIDSPDWMPSIPKIQAAIRRIEFEAEAKKRLKTPDEIFRESHCGKSTDEWKQLKDWELSPEGRRKIEHYKQRLLELLGGKQQ